VEPADVELLAAAAQLIGKDEESTDLWQRACQELARRGRPARAARCAIRLAFGLQGRGEMARVSGWFARARRLLEEEAGDCAERGFLFLPVALQSLAQGDAAGAMAAFVQAGEIGARFGDVDLLTMARLGQGHATVMAGNTAEGM